MQREREAEVRRIDGEDDLIKPETLGFELWTQEDEAASIAGLPGAEIGC